MDGAPCVGVVTFPVSYTGDYYSLSLIRVLSGFARSIILITGEVGYRYAKNEPKVKAIQVVHTPGVRIPARITRFLATQLELTLELAKHSSEVDRWVFHNGGDVLPLALLTARFLRRRPILIVTGSPAQISRLSGDRFSGLIRTLTRLSFTIAAKIVVHSDSIIATEGLEAWRPKIAAAHEHYVDFDAFNVLKPLAARDLNVGYVGRLSPEKGVLNFVEAARKILKLRTDVVFSLGGIGPLENRLRAFVEREHLENNVKLLGFIPHEQMCDHLNNLRLLVMPSYTEGLPTAVVEAFATGTPVLATSVGALPDFLKDGETGFTLMHNSPQVVAMRIVETLARPDLEYIAANARLLAKKEFTYEAAVEKFARILLSNP